MLRCRTLGVLELSSPTEGEHTAVLAQPKRVALLVYLAVANSGGFHRRDTLLALFWPELDQERARAALRQALTFLRHELGEDIIRTRGSEEVGVDTERIWCDAVAFEVALQSDEPERALDLYRGEFLTGFHLSECGEFERWVEARRGALSNRAAEAAARLVDRAEAAGSLTDAVRWARRTLELRPDDEEAVRRLLLCLDRAGDRAKALHEYEAFAKRLASEYQVEPSPETQAIVAEIRARQGSVRMLGPSEASPGISTVAIAPIVWRRPVIAAAIVGSLIVAGLGGYWGRNGRASRDRPEPDMPRLAVLPFENLGAAEDEFFADGITDEITTKLAGLRGLAVISPQSVRGYKGTTKGTDEIGLELDVQYLLQGTVRWQRQPNGSIRVLVTPRLITVSGDRHLWAREFDEVLEDVFRVQGQIAVQVTSALGLTLLSREQETVTRRLTQNVAAYERYLRGGRTGWPAFEGWREVVAALENAVTLDPEFAEAHARLSMAHGWVRWQDWDPSQDAQHLAKQQEYAARAVALDSGLAEGHAAMGWYYYMVHRDFQQALQEFSIALAAEPNNAFFIAGEATVYKRTGNFAAAAQAYGRASDLDPLSPNAAAEAGVEYMLLRRYGEAERYFARAAAINARPATAHLAYLRLMRDGDPKSLRAWLEAALGAGFPQLVATAAHGGGWGYWIGPLTRSLCGECDAAIPVIRPVREGDWQRYQAIALLHDRAGRTEEARIYLDSARVRLEALGPAFPPLPAWAYAKLGRKEQAVRVALAQVEAPRQAKDVFAETLNTKYLADLYVMVGEYSLALKHMDWLLNRPSLVSVPLLRADPLYDPLRNHPRFQALLAKYDNPSRN